MTEENLQVIDTLLEKIQNARPLSRLERQELEKSLQVEFTYNSNAIEGNTITRGETKILLEDGLTIGGHTLRELHETTNHKNIFPLLKNFLEKKEDITETYIKKIHQEVLKNISDEDAGKYRKIQVYISGEEISPPDASEIPKLMEDLIQWYQENQNIHPVELAAKFHYKFVKIHPFIDGNGRTIRILMNMILMRQSYPMIIIPNVRRSEYIQSLHSTKTFKDFYQFFTDIVKVNLQDYTRMINIK